MSSEGFERFRQLVLSDPGLQRQLQSATDRDALVARTVELAARCGLAVTVVDVEAALAAARRSWHERWL